MNNEILDMILIVLHLLSLIVFITTKLIILMIRYSFKIEIRSVRKDSNIVKQKDRKESIVLLNQSMNDKTLKVEIETEITTEKSNDCQSNGFNFNNDDKYQLKDRLMPKNKMKSVFKTIIYMIFALIILGYLFNNRLEKKCYSFMIERQTQNSLELKPKLNYNRTNENVSKIMQNIRYFSERIKKMNFKHFRKKCFLKN